MRDYKALLADVPCWDEVGEYLTQVQGHPGQRLLQNRDELVLFCEWIEAHNIRSYLEIGCWTGGLVSSLDRIFHFDKLAVCDIRHAEYLGLQMQVPERAACFWGDSKSPEFVKWRQELGHFDLVFIDGDHEYTSAMQDLQINRRMPGRYLGFHDIHSEVPIARGMAQLWRELEGEKTELYVPYTHSKLKDTQLGIGLWKMPETPAS